MMSDAEKLVEVYFGPIINVMALTDFLKENHIASLIRDDYSESMAGGWIAPGSLNAARVFIKQQDYIKARFLIEKFLEELE